jgi:hypothetical protein
VGGQRHRHRHPERTWPTSGRSSTGPATPAARRSRAPAWACHRQRLVTGFGGRVSVIQQAGRGPPSRWPAIVTEDAAPAWRSRTAEPATGNLAGSTHAPTRAGSPLARPRSIRLRARGLRGAGFCRRFGPASRPERRCPPPPPRRALPRSGNEDRSISPGRRWDGPKRHALVRLPSGCLPHARLCLATCGEPPPDPEDARPEGRSPTRRRPVRTPGSRPGGRRGGRRARRRGRRGGRTPRRRAAASRPDAAWCTAGGSRHLHRRRRVLRLAQAHGGPVPGSRGAPVLHPRCAVDCDPNAVPSPTRAWSRSPRGRLPGGDGAGRDLLHRPLRGRARGDPPRRQPRAVVAVLQPRRPPGARGLAQGRGAAGLRQPDPGRRRLRRGGQADVHRPRVEARLPGPLGHDVPVRQRAADRRVQRPPLRAPRGRALRNRRELDLLAHRQPLPESARRGAGEDRGLRMLRHRRGRLRHDGQPCTSGRPTRPGTFRAASTWTRSSTATGCLYATTAHRRLALGLFDGLRCCADGFDDQDPAFAGSGDGRRASWRPGPRRRRHGGCLH